MRIKPLPTSFNFSPLMVDGISPMYWKAIHQAFTQGQERKVRAIAGTFAKEINENLGDLFECRGFQKGQRKYRMVHKWNGKRTLIIDTDLDYDKMDLRFLVFGEDGKALMFLQFHLGKNGEEQLRHGLAPSLRRIPLPEQDENARVMVMFLVSLDVFMHNAKVQTRVLPPRKKLKEFNCRYYNEGTQGDVEVYDTRFFTTVTGSPFPVKGHIRMQACGVGRNERRPVWITGYTKGGVKRKAKIDK